MKKKIISFFLSFFIFFATSINAYATGLEIPVGLTLYEVISGLLLSAGVTYMGYEMMDNSGNIIDVPDDVWQEQYVPDGNVVRWLGDTYDANLRMVENQNPSPSSSPEPSTSPSPSGRRWNALVSAVTTDKVIRWGKDEWSAWRATVEAFLNNAYSGFDFLNQTESNSMEYIAQGLSELNTCSYPYYAYKTASTISSSKLGTATYLFFGSSKCTVTYRYAEGLGRYVLDVLSPDSEYMLFERIDGSTSGKNHGWERINVDSHMVFAIDFSQNNMLYAYNMPLSNGTVAPIGDRPSKDTVKTVPGLEPVVNPDGTPGKVTVPDVVPDVISVPDASEYTALKNDIKTDPDKAGDAIEELMQEHVLAIDPVPDPGENPSPSASPATPIPDVVEDIDLSGYRYGLSDFFPFCIPKDFVHLLSAFNADPVTPVFDVPIKIDYLDFHINYVIKLDLSDFEPLSKIFRILCVIAFIGGLAVLSSKVIKW